MKNNNFMDSLFNEMARELRKEIDIESLLNEAIKVIGNIYENPELLEE